MVKRNPASSRLYLLTFSSCLLEFDFLLGQILLGLLEHLRGVENFHDLQFFGVPGPPFRSPTCTSLTLPFKCWASAYTTSKPCLEEVIAAQASVFVQRVLVVQSSAGDGVFRPAFLRPGNALGSHEAAQCRGSAVRSASRCQGRNARHDFHCDRPTRPDDSVPCGSLARQQ
jgi:hypothetical protein